MRIRLRFQFFIIAGVVGIVLPFILTLCLFGTTLQTFVAGQAPTPGFWSGAPTAAPTRIPSPVQEWSRTAFSSADGAVFLLWSVLGACAGEAVALRVRRDPWIATRTAWLGAVAGSVIFLGITLCGGLLR